MKIGNTENIKPTQYTIFTNSTTLAKLNVSGSVKAHLKGKLETEDLDIIISGSGNITIDDLTSNSLEAKLSGSGKFDVAGTTSLLNSSISGSGKFDATNLKADSVYCSVSGSGNFNVQAEEYLNVRITGSGKVNYNGNPDIDRSISGSGKVVKAD